MNARVHSVGGSVLFLVGLAAAAGCGRSSPVSPTAAAAPVSTGGLDTAASQPVMRPAGGAVVTATLAGTFTVSNDTGDSLTGTYSGTATSSPGTTEQALLTLQITGGTGVYAGARGTADGQGYGAFSGEGTYSLAGRGDAVLGSGKHAQITMNLAGTSAASCDIDASQLVITQTGGGTVGRAGRSTSTFRHHLTSGASCMP